MTLMRGGKLTEVQRAAMAVGKFLQTRLEIHERAEDYAGGW